MLPTSIGISVISPLSHLTTLHLANDTVQRVIVANNNCCGVVQFMGRYAQLVIGPAGSGKVTQHTTEA